MDAVRLMGEIVKKTAEATKENDSLGCAKLVVFCNAPDDNPFMAGAFHGVTEADAIINVGVSGPGVVKVALEKARGENFEVLCETIKKTAFKITVLVSWLPRRLLSVSRCSFRHYCLILSLALRLLQWETVLQRFWRRSAWNGLVRRAQRQRLPC